MPLSPLIGRISGDFSSWTELVAGSGFSPGLTCSEAALPGNASSASGLASGSAAPAPKPRIRLTHTVNRWIGFIGLLLLTTLHQFFLQIILSTARATLGLRDG